MSLKIAILDDYQGIARTIGPWEQLGERVEITTFTSRLGDENAVAKALQGFGGIVAMRERTPFPRSLIERLPDLELLVTTGPFNAVIDTDAAAEHGVTVSATGHSYASTLELTWALILNISRHVCAEDRAVREGGWQHTVGPELSGRTLALVGFGNISKLMVPIAQAFGMDVIAWSQNLRPEDARALGVKPVRKEELFAGGDFVSVHYKLSERSVGIVGAAELTRMKPTAYLINTSRGPIVDESALLGALSNGQIAGAALDVFDEEPLALHHPLRSLPNTLLTPHIGYVATTHYEGWYADAVEDIRTYLDGDPVRVIARPGEPGVVAFRGGS
jgi:phosphoglycerate dehydrogenase-like enzyme